MNKLKSFTTITALCMIIFHVSINAEGFIKKEVYSFKDKNGNLVFTDKQPNKNLVYQTQTVEAANSTANNQDTNTYDESHRRNDSNNINNSVQTVKVIVENRSSTKKKSSKKAKSFKHCKTYKRKFAYYSEKLKSGYKNSEYKKLESNRKKYRNLLFNNCETKTFSD